MRRSPLFSVVGVLVLAAGAAVAAGAIGRHLSTATPALPGPVTVRSTGSPVPRHAAQLFQGAKGSTGALSGGGQPAESPEQPERVDTVLPRGAVLVIPGATRPRRETQHQDAGASQSGGS